MSARLAALGLLMADISRHQENGEPVPCVDPAVGHRWLSDDRQEQEAAAHGCLTLCPAFAACESYVNAHPEPTGVWAGVYREQTPLRRKHA